MGAITAAVIGAGTAIYSAKQSKKQQKAAQKSAEQMLEKSDPFSQYRPQYAEQLAKLTSDPTYLQNTGTYKARLQAAERVMAAQGYTGSGNALVAAADAGADAYQQEFNNLAMLAGAGVGLQNQTSAYGVGQGAIGNANDNYLSGLAGVGNNLANLATVWRGRVNTPVATQPVTNPGSLYNFGNNVGGFISGGG